ASTLQRNGKQIVVAEMAPDSNAVQTFQEEFPGLGDVRTIEADVYGAAEDASTLAFWNLMACADSMPDEVAYEITKTVFENLDELHDSLEPAVDTTVENNLGFIGETTIPFHPGAVQYFEEVGGSE